MNFRRPVVCAVGCLLLWAVQARAEGGPESDVDKTQQAVQFHEKQMKQAPSFMEKEWTGTQAGMESYLEYNYVGGASQDLGNGHNQNVAEQYLDAKHEFLRHTLLAFLVEVGFEYQYMGFHPPNSALLPDRLDEGLFDVTLDSRWSKHDLLHIQVRPGIYTDWGGAGWNAINYPVDIGYTHVVSDYFQWVIGFSWNSWRNSRFLGAGGIRWQWNDRWKLKLYMPTPDIEYYARPNLTLTLGADIRGDSFRVGPHFGTQRGHPDFNDALVDYQEVRVGPGFSWNILPLLELNFMTGYMVGRQFNFHNNIGGTFNSSGSPFVMVQFHWLFKFKGEPLHIPQSNRLSISDIWKFL